MSEKKFRCWIPIDTIKKSKDKDGNEVFLVGGIASTSKKDLDGETLNPTPEGFDVTYLKERGVVNWNHSKDPDKVIGEPSKVEFVKGGMYVESMLYPDNPMAQKVYKLGKSFQKYSTTRRLGYSIEGSALLRDANDPSYVPKARITGLALTVNPKNTESFVDILKGEFNEFTDDDNEQKETAELLLTKANEPEIAEPKYLTKAQCFEKIFDRCGVISLERADNIYKSINNLTMEVKNTGTEVTEDMLEKALTHLMSGNTATGAAGTTLEKALTTGGAATTTTSTAVGTATTPLVASLTDEQFEKLQKSISAPIQENFTSVGLLLKGLRDQNKAYGETLEAIKTENAQQKETIGKLEKAISDIADQPQGRRSVATTKTAEKQFVKSLNGDENEEGNGNALEKAIADGKAIRITSKRAIVNLLDEMTFEKGVMDADMAKALTTYEASGHMEAATVARIKTARGITIVK